MRKIRLRTKFLLSLLAISGGLTAATLFIVSYSVQKRVRASLREDLRNSVNTHESFERQRDFKLVHKNKYGQDYVPPSSPAYSHP